MKVYETFGPGSNPGGVTDLATVAQDRGTPGKGTVAGLRFPAGSRDFGYNISTMQRKMPSLQKLIESAAPAIETQADLNEPKNKAKIFKAAKAFAGKGASVIDDEIKLTLNEKRRTTTVGLAMPNRGGNARFRSRTVEVNVDTLQCKYDDNDQNWMK